MFTYLGANIQAKGIRWHERGNANPTDCFWSVTYQSYWNKETPQTRPLAIKDKVTQYFSKNLSLWGRVEKGNFDSCHVFCHSENNKSFCLFDLGNKNESLCFKKKKMNRWHYSAWSEVQGKGHYSLLQHSLGSKCERGNPDAPVDSFSRKFEEAAKAWHLFLGRGGGGRRGAVQTRRSPPLPGSLSLPFPHDEPKHDPFLHLLYKACVLIFFKWITVTEWF